MSIGAGGPRSVLTGGPRSVHSGGLEAVQVGQGWHPGGQWQLQSTDRLLGGVQCA